MSTDTVPPVSASGDFPFSIYTIRGSRFLAADHKRGGTGEFTENKRWTSALGFLDSARKAGQRLPLLFAAGERIRGVIYFASIDDLFVSPPDENGNGTTTISFSGLRPLRPKQPLSSLILRSSGEPLSDDFIKPYAICHTPDFLPPPIPHQTPVAARRREASSTKKALKLHTFRHGDAPKRGEGLRIGTTRRPPRGKTKDEWGAISTFGFPSSLPATSFLQTAPLGSPVTSVSCIPVPSLGRHYSYSHILPYAHPSVSAAIARTSPIAIAPISASSSSAKPASCNPRFEASIPKTGNA